MIGLACKAGSITITDMDTIEKSNLNRQFLFRSRDVTKLKSEAASAAVRTMNPDLRITARATRVGKDTEAFYDDAFYATIDGVANALDNIDARKYMDERCVVYRKPLLESGTLGTKCNTQVVLPDLTESYGSSVDPPEKSIPVCTLKNFPYTIEHTLEWARDLFEGLFVQTPESVNLFLRQPGYLDGLMSQPGAQPLDALEAVSDCLIVHRPTSLADCVAWARLRFETYFASSISQLLYNFPADKIIDKEGPFWSGTKRCPHPIVFDITLKQHTDFIEAAASLRAHMFHLKGVITPAIISTVLATLQVPKFVVKTSLHIETDEKKAATAATAARSMDDDVTLEDAIRHLPPPSNFAGVQLSSNEFEKDDDNNFHIAFITATSNLRAAAYSIEPADRHKSKLIAGKIIPAIATTTAMVAGFVVLELYKVVQRHAVERFRNTFANLALPFIAQSEPQPPAKYKYGAVTWTLWDRFDVRGRLSLRDLLALFTEKHGLTITTMSCGVSMLYTNFTSKAKLALRLPLTMKEIYEEVTKKALQSQISHLILEVNCDDEEGNDCNVPSIFYHL